MRAKQAGGKGISLLTGAKYHRVKTMVQDQNGEKSKLGKLPGLCGLLLLACSGLAAAAEQDPQLEAQFKQGLEALKEDRLKAAIQAFSSILDQNPELHRARLELALAYYRSMRYEEAEKLAQRVLDDPTTPPQVRVTILAFLAQIKRDSEQFGRKHTFKPFISAGVMHDSNVNVGPTSEFLQIGDATLTLTNASLAQSDNAYVLNAGVDHLYQSGRHIDIGETTGMLVWQTGASVYRRKYNRLHDFDLGIASFSTGPGVLLLRRWRASLQYQTDYLTLGGGALGWFNSLTPSITWQFVNGELTWDAIYTHRQYNREIDEGREGEYLATGLTLGRYMNKRKVAATAGARLIDFYADDDQYSYYGYQLTLGINADSWPGGNVYARGRLSNFNYDDPDRTFLKTREEKEFRATVGFTHEFKGKDDLLKNWAVNGFWERTFNNSNVSAYTYKRYQLMLSLSRRF